MNDALSADLASAQTLTELANHPVVDALPEPAVRCLQHKGRALRLAGGSLLPDAPRVYFVMTGAVGVFIAPGSSCVGFVGPGGLHGLDRCFAPSTGERLVCLLDTDVIQVEADAFAAAMGTHWTERMFGHQATGRLRSLAAEAVCSAKHTVPRRVARWLLRLEAAALPHPSISVTQSTLAGILGVQRTTANAALVALQERGVIRTRRGVITIVSRLALMDMACTCDEATLPSR